MRNPDHGATAINFIAILQSIDYNKFERFSNVADEISAKLLPSFLECELLVVIPDRYGFKFTVKGKKTPDRRLNSYTGNWNYWWPKSSKVISKLPWELEQ